MSALVKIKAVKNAVLYRQGEGDKAVDFILLKNVRLSFPAIGTPREDENDNGDKQKKYSTTCMLPKATHVEAKDLVKEVIERLIAKNQVTVGKDKWCLANGDDKSDVNLKGYWVVNASDGKVRPTARDQRGVVIDDIGKIDDMFYGGCWANVMIRPWYFDGKAKNGKNYGKRIPSGLAAVQFVKNDTPFGGGRVDTSDVAWSTDDNDGDDGMGAGAADEDDGL